MQDATRVLGEVVARLFSITQRPAKGDLGIVD